MPGLNQKSLNQRFGFEENVLNSTEKVNQRRLLSVNLDDSEFVKALVDFSVSATKVTDFRESLLTV